MEWNDPLQVVLELTTHCNSQCLDCGRYVGDTTTINPNIDIGKKGLLSLQAVKNLCSDEDMIRSIWLSGSYGDAPWHPKFFDILDMFPDNVQLGLETNGGMKDVTFWKHFGHIVKNKFADDSILIFGIDGPNNEIHQKYRRGVDFNKVIENALAAKEGGAKICWSMIEFDYNSHLIEECKQFADKLGFKFKIRRSRIRHRLKNAEKYKLSDRQKEVVKKLSHKVVFHGSGNKDHAEKMKDKIDIECEWKKKNQISVDYTSRLWMCCYFSAFYHHKPTSVDDKSTSESNRIRDGLIHYVNQYEDKWNFLENYTLKEILNHKFFTTDLEKSFLDTKEFPIIKRCIKHCNAEVREANDLLYGSAAQSYKKAMNQ